MITKFPQKKPRYLNLLLSLPLFFIILSIPFQGYGIRHQGPGHLLTVPSPTIRLVEVASGFNLPNDIANSGVPGDERLFIVEKPGKIKIIEGSGNVLPTAFLDITAQVQSNGIEQGLLGLTFHPDYQNNGYLFVTYTYTGDNDEDPGDIRISRFRVSLGDPNMADPNSEMVVMMIPHHTYPNNNGGDLAFGPDGYLYIALGDGGGEDDPEQIAQDLSQLKGKLLRIDVDGSFPYTIPLDNPYVGDPTALDEIWASGLRNPWRFSFDRDTNDIYIGDVGDESYEEIDYQPAASSGGENYGWSCFEGNHPFITSGCGPASDYDFPIHEYDHSTGRAVVGGFVYRGNQFPEMRGHYLFADFVYGLIWSMFYDGSSWQIKSQGTYTGSAFSSFGEDVSGELYLADLNNFSDGSGVIYQLYNLQNNMYFPVSPVTSLTIPPSNSGSRIASR
jgi:glucose/arabinose dehydrogenase